MPRIVKGEAAANPNVIDDIRPRPDTPEDEAAAAARARRRRAGPRHHPSEYPKGAVVRVKLHNFMTYGDVEMEPGPRLNVILGPNGTGKSSFVCALAIGLAGSTRLLGRADKIAEFVKRGEESGYSEITLATGSDSGTMVVKREIRRRDASSVWKVNGVIVTQERVKREMKALGVQLDNLCQFLPQDRVVEFAKMTPEQLLLETEKTIENGQLHDKHASLIEMKQGIADLERDVSSKRARVEKLKLENASLERDVDRFNEREKLVKEAEDMKKKRPWLEHEKARSKWGDAKQNLKECNRLIAEKERELAQFTEPVTLMNRLTTENHARLQAASKAKRDASRRRENATNELEDLATDATRSAKQLQNARERIMKQRGQLAAKERELQRAKKALADAPEPPDNAKELAEAKKAANDKNLEWRAVENKRDDLHAQLRQPQARLKSMEDRLAGIDSIRGQKLERLQWANQRSGRFNIQRGDEYVREHRNGFHKPVIGPLLTLVECEDATHRNYLEQNVPRWAWGTYITQDDRDRDKLSQAFKDFGLNVMNITNVSYREPDVSHLRSWGVTHRLDQCFQAEPIVKQALCDAGNVDRAFVMDPKVTDEQVEKLLKETNDVPKALTPRTVFNKAKSRYDPSAITLSTYGVKNSQLFTANANASQRAEVVEEIKGLKDDVATVKRSIEAANQEWNALQGQYLAATKRRDFISSMRRDAVQKKNALQQQMQVAEKALDLCRKSEDVEGLEASVAAKLKENTEKREKAVAAVTEATAACLKHMRERTACFLRAEECKVQSAHLQEVLDAAKGDQNDLLATKDECVSNCVKTKEKARETKQAAESEAPMTPELQEKFLEYPATTEELDETIDAIETEADAILCPNGMVLEDFKRRKQEIDAIEADLKTGEAELTEKQSDIATVKDAWLPKLRELVDNINEQFKNNFAAIGCAGEVKLEERGDAFDAYRLELYVKFRAATDMHILDAHRQSGGERSVSTMLYLISLQELTKAPFRVVDEINQGMDPVNERKIFKRMTNAASREDTPQTFLLTPKLLNNLEYTEDCTVLCIFNGPWIAETAKQWRGIQSLLMPMGAGGGPGTP